MRPIARTLRLIAGAALLVAAAGRGAGAMPVAGQPPAEQGLLCRQAIQAAETGSGLPPNMLVGIARVESGRRDAVTGHFHPWPWTINAEGRGFFFDSKAEAAAFARQLQARGVRSFDVGCMQVNMMHHGSAFASLEEAFDPGANARYAVRFLGQLKEKSGSWETASAWYHSANPEYGAPYRAMVVAAMAAEAKNPADRTMLASAGSAGAPAGMGTGGALQSMPRGPGTVTYLTNGGGGRIIPLPYVSYPSFANGGIPAVPQDMPPRLGGGMGMGGIGRGLDAYRAQPVAMVVPRTALAAR